MADPGTSSPPAPVDGPGPADRPSRMARLERWFDRVENVPEGERTPELMRYIARSEIPIDQVALFTIWLSVIPFTAELHAVRHWWLAARVGLSLVFLVDLVIRAHLSRRPWPYVRDHPFAVLAVAFPPIRVILSVRLLRRAFHRGNLGKFLGVAAILIANAAVICWAFERGAAHANITTIWQALWWSIVTVTTVGYGDYTPVTTGGRITAVAVMGLGVLTLAVVTATIASKFRDQAARADLDVDLPADSRLDAVTTQRLLTIRAGIDALLGPTLAADADPALAADGGPAPAPDGPGSSAT